MADSTGFFVWYELMTSDVAAAKGFYGRVLGWRAEDVPMPGMTYTLVKVNDTQVGGLMPVPKEARDAGMKPCWVGYIAVPDVDQGAKKVASLGGKVSTFVLHDALKQGPVVLYFYPAAFTEGCTIEAHEFAEATDRYKALGAQVIGVSHDDIATLNKFSVSECRSKFAVAADPDRSIMKAYDATLPLMKFANRVSYVIAPDGSIIYSYTSMAPDKHVENTLNALQLWTAQHKKP